MKEWWKENRDFIICMVALPSAFLLGGFGGVLLVGFHEQLTRLVGLVL